MQLPPNLFYIALERNKSSDRYVIDSNVFDWRYYIGRMAKYPPKAQKKVQKAMHEMKEGALRSGSSGKKVKSRKQAIAIGLSEARREGAKVPKKDGKKKSK